MQQITSKDIEIIYDITFDKVYKFFYYKTLSKEIAEDLTSEAFFTFVRHCKENKEIEDMEKYLWGIVRNVFVRYLTQKYQEPIPVGDNIDKFTDYIENFVVESDSLSTVEEKANKYIQMLPDSQRVILYMRLIEKKNLSQICSELKKDMNYVKTTQKRGIANLKRMVCCTP